MAMGVALMLGKQVWCVHARVARALTLTRLVRQFSFAFSSVGAATAMMLRGISYLTGECTMSCDCTSPLCARSGGRLRPAKLTEDEDMSELPLPATASVHVSVV
jgi:hypothetical protein